MSRVPVLSLTLALLTVALLGLAPIATLQATSAQATALVTGANRGIGLALAKQLKAEGYQVIGTARTPEEAKELAATGARVLQLDVTDAKSVAAMVDALKSQPIDLLVNNAGVSSRTEAIATLDLDAVERTIAVNTIGPMRVTQALLPNLRAGSGKTVIGISSRLASIAGNAGGKYYGYRESKAALNMFLRSLAAELKGDGFVVVTMSPGWVRTDMGGGDAPLSPEESAIGLVKVIKSLKPGDTGKFLSYDGAEIAW